jgi:hypothetical protein
VLRDGFEVTDGDVRRAGVRVRLKGGERNLGGGVREGCLRKRGRAGEREVRCENDA